MFREKRFIMHPLNLQIPTWLWRAQSLSSKKISGKVLPVWAGLMNAENRRIMDTSGMYYANALNYALEMCGDSVSVFRIPVLPFQPPFPACFAPEGTSENSHCSTSASHWTLMNHTGHIEKLYSMQLFLFDYSNKYSNNLLYYITRYRKPEISDMRDFEQKSQVSSIRKPGII